MDVDSVFTQAARQLHDQSQFVPSVPPTLPCDVIKQDDVTNKNDDTTTNNDVTPGDDDVTHGDDDVDIKPEKQYIDVLKEYFGHAKFRP